MDEWQEKMRGRKRRKQILSGKVVTGIILIIIALVAIALGTMADM